MGVLSSCNDVPRLAFCDLCDDSELKPKCTVHVNLPQVLAAAAQQLPGMQHVDSDHTSEEVTQQLEAVEFAQATPLGLLKSCYPLHDALAAERAPETLELPRTESDGHGPESAEERLYFERLEAASRKAREEEERQLREEVEREREEEAQQAAARRLRRAKREARERARQDQEKVDAFLKANGFAGVLSKRKRLFMSCYPLHLAVDENNPAMVTLLLQAGADRDQRNSLGQTPHALAVRRNRDGSHERLLDALSQVTEVRAAS